MPMRSNKGLPSLTETSETLAPPSSSRLWNRLPSATWTRPEVPGLPMRVLRTCRRWSSSSGPPRVVSHRVGRRRSVTAWEASWLIGWLASITSSSSGARLSSWRWTWSTATAPRTSCCGVTSSCSASPVCSLLRSMKRSTRQSSKTSARSPILPTRRRT